MRFRTLVLAALLVLGAAACDQNDPEADVTGDTDTTGEFSLTGMVLDAAEGAEPEGGLPGVDADVDANVDEDGADADANVETTDDASEESDEHGGFAIEPEDEEAATNLDDCEATRGAYLVYYTGDTEFTPDTLRDDANFPDNLEDQHVTVTGTNDADDGDDCVLVIEDLEVVEDAEMDIDTDDDTTGGTGGGTGGTGDDADADGDGSPSPSGSPEVEESGETFFPNVDDTDPIFEGTASPDACEGQDACRETDSP